MDINKIIKGGVNYQDYLEMTHQFNFNGIEKLKNAKGITVLLDIDNTILKLRRITKQYALYIKNIILENTKITATDKERLLLKIFQCNKDYFTENEELIYVYFIDEIFLSTIPELNNCFTLSLFTAVPFEIAKLYQLLIELFTGIKLDCISSFYMNGKGEILRLTNRNPFLTILYDDSEINIANFKSYNAIAVNSKNISWSHLLLYLNQHFLGFKEG